PYGVPILPGTPPGRYQVEIGIYRPADGGRLPIADAAGVPLGDRLLLGPIEVRKPSAPPALDALPIEHARAETFGPLRLLGYELYRLGADRGAIDFRPADVAHLGLWWQATVKPPASLRVKLTLLDEGGRAVLERETSPADGAYP